MAEFPSTHWSFVSQLREADEATRRGLVEQFLLRYLPPLREYLARQYHDLAEQDRDDLLQEFVTNQVIQKSLLERARQDRGKLRSFLRVCLNNFVRNFMARSRVDPLYGAASLELLELRDDRQGDPILTFDTLWARFVLTEAVQRVRDECKQGNRRLMWEVFNRRVLRPVLTGELPPSYQELSHHLNTPTKRLENLLVSAKRMFARKLREVINPYTTDPNETEQEIVDLWDIAVKASRQHHLRNERIA